MNNRDGYDKLKAKPINNVINMTYGEYCKILSIAMNEDYQKIMIVENATRGELAKHKWDTTNITRVLDKFRKKEQIDRKDSDLLHNYYNLVISNIHQQFDNKDEQNKKFFDAFSNFKKLCNEVFVESKEIFYNLDVLTDNVVEFKKISSFSNDSPMSDVTTDADESPNYMMSRSKKTGLHSKNTRKRRKGNSPSATNSHTRKRRNNNLLSYTKEYTSPKNIDLPLLPSRNTQKRRNDNSLSYTKEYMLPENTDLPLLPSWNTRKRRNGNSLSYTGRVYDSDLNTSADTEEDNISKRSKPRKRSKIGLVTSSLGTSSIGGKFKSKKTRKIYHKKQLLQTLNAKKTF